MISEIQIDRSVLKRFSALNEKKRMAHAYLFIGPADIGKGETALSIAKLINCETPEKKLFCDACPACAKINAGTHPDVFIIDNQMGESIKIGQIRELLNSMKLRPLLAEKKVIIIRNIENFTLESANAFLKTLEEPAGSNVILLTTSVPEQNLDTIRSRCHAVYFQPLSNGELEKRLLKDRGLKDGQAHFLAYFAQGCPGAVKRLLDTELIGYKDEVIEGFIFRQPDDDYLKGVVEDKEQTKIFLNILLSWIRDAIMVKSGIDDGRLIHLDRSGELCLFAQRYSFEELEDLNGSIINMYKLLAENLNIKLPLMIIGEQLWEK